MFTALAIGTSLIVTALVAALLMLVIAWASGIEDELARHHRGVFWLAVATTVAQITLCGVSVLLWHKALA